MVGAAGVYVVEDRSRFPSFMDAVWWAIVTATTVGYGDLSPSTNEGRLIAVLLMLSGIGVIAVLTGTIAGLFFEQESEHPIESRLDRIEAKVDRLLASLDRQGP